MIHGTTASLGNSNWPCGRSEQLVGELRGAVLSQELWPGRKWPPDSPASAFLWTFLSSQFLDMQSRCCMMVMSSFGAIPSESQSAVPSAAAR